MKAQKHKGSSYYHLWKWLTSNKTKTKHTFKLKSVFWLNFLSNMPHTQHFCLTSLKLSFKLYLNHPSFQNIFTILFRLQKFLYKLKSQFLLHFTYLTVKKFQKLGKNSSKRNSSNSDKQVREMIFHKKFFKRFFSKSIRIQVSMKSLEMSFNTSLIIAKILKKSLKQKFINISNVIGNILLLNK